MDEKKNVDETLDGVKTDAADGEGKAEDIVKDIDALAEEAVADASKAKAEADPDASADPAADTVEDSAKKAEAAADAATGKAADVKDKTESSADAVAGKAADTATGAEKLAADTAQKTADSAKEAATPVKEDKAEKKPAAKVDPRYDKIFWPTAGKVWSNTLTVIIVAALMAGTIFLVDLGLRAIIDGFMSI